MKELFKHPLWIKWQPKLIECLRDYHRADFIADLIAGLTVGLIALPLAMAFGIASGVTRSCRMSSPMCCCNAGAQCKSAE